MLERHVELRIVEWDDTPFRQAVEEALVVVRRTEPPAIDASRAGAELQRLIRAAGFRSATVTVHQTVDEALAHVSRVEVRREAVGLLSTR